MKLFSECSRSSGGPGGIMPSLTSVKRGTLEKDLSERELSSRLLSYGCGRKYPKQSGFPRQWFLRTSPTSRYSKLTGHMNIYLIQLLLLECANLDLLASKSSNTNNCAVDRPNQKVYQSDI